MHPFKCSYCNNGFSKNKNLRYHVRKMHPTMEQPPPLKKKLFIKDEDALNQQESQDFASHEDFLCWLKKEEELQRCIFSIRSSVMSNLCRKIYYRCHRGGYFHSRSKGKRFLKMGGSCKMNVWCTASINVKINSDGATSIKYFKKHIEHVQTNSHLRLNKSKRRNGSTKLEQVNLADHCDNLLKEIRAECDTSQNKDELYKMVIDKFEIVKALISASKVDPGKPLPEPQPNKPCRRKRESKTSPKKATKKENSICLKVEDNEKIISALPVGEHDYSFYTDFLNFDHSYGK